MGSFDLAISVGGTSLLLEEAEHASTGVNFSDNLGSGRYETMIGYTRVI